MKDKDIVYFNGQTTKERALGYCHNPKHKGYLTHKIIQQRGCTKKGCKYFHKYEDHPFWQKKKAAKEKKKLMKKMLQ